MVRVYAAIFVLILMENKTIAGSVKVVSSGRRRG